MRDQAKMSVSKVRSCLKSDVGSGSVVRRRSSRGAENRTTGGLCTSWEGRVRRSVRKV